MTLYDTKQSSTMIRKRINYYDVLKAVAIIAVVLFHLGVCTNGYLGVDMFFVIAGFFTATSIDKRLATNGGCLKFIKQRLFRMWPLLIIAGIVCLAYGWFMMLPDDYENAAQSVVATNFFGNNILLSITTSDYWVIYNQYKPLMHTWFVGVLMQYYVLITILCFTIEKVICKPNIRRTVFGCSIMVLGVLSILVYYNIIYTYEHFYYLPTRFFELACGSLAYYILALQRIKIPDSRPVKVLFCMVNALVLMILLINIDTAFMPDKLITIVLSTTLLLLLSSITKISHNKIFANKFVALIGAASFSIYVWHQVVIALTRYSFTSNLLEPIVFFVVVALIVSLSVLSYKYVENIAETKQVWSVLCIGLILSTSFALHLYCNAGVVRDIPELDVVKGESHSGMWAEYCDRGYLYNKDFTNSTKPKWFVAGNSFGRDFVNIIEESDIANDVEVSYSDGLQKQRIAQADVVFISTLWLREKFVDKVKSLCKPQAKVYIVGEKNFGESNGQVYSRRFRSDYKDMVMPIQDIFIKRNKKFKTLYKDHFIDLISYVLQSNNRVRVFSDDGRYISQDCQHLTRAGAQFYAKHIDWSMFFEKE